MIVRKCHAVTEFLLCANCTNDNLHIDSLWT